MKTVINLVLAACVVALVYICYGSIMGPINFDKEKEVRDNAIKTRLIDIRKAQQEYRGMHNGAYTADFDTLIDFIKTAKTENRPFLLSVSFKAPHGPMSPDPAFDEIYADTVWEQPPNYDEKGAAAAMAEYGL